ncbi:MAG: sugar phosphate isomerase/epimerase, partial [Eudoraea sp.]
MKKLKTKTTLKLLFSIFLLAGTFMVNAQEKFGGLALYTVRDAMESDAKTTLQAVADAGYSYLEAAGYNDGKFYNMTPGDFKKLLNQ